VEVSASHCEKAIQPLSTQKIDTLVMSVKNTSQLSQLLIQHSPVFIKTYGPGALSTASFRGTTASHTLVLWNGFQLNAPNMGQVDFSTIPVFMADNLSLGWGSGGSANSGGLGGVVNIETFSGFCKGLQLELKQAYGCFNTWGTFLTIGHSGKRFSVRLKAYRNSSDNDFEYENSATIPHQTMKQKNSEFMDFGLMPELHFMTIKGVISFVSWNQWNDRNLPPIMPNVGNLNSVEWTKDSFSRNHLSYKMYWKTGSFQAKSGCFIEKQNYFLETKNPVTDDRITYINSSNKSWVLHELAELEQSIYQSWKLNAKVQWDMEQVQSDNYEGTKSRDVVSFYAAMNGQAFPDVDLNFTLRFDVVDGRSKGVFPTMSFSYEMPFLPEMTAALGYSHNYRNPSLNDLYWYPGGNENLLSEDGRTFDFEIKLGRQNNVFPLNGGLACTLH
jgi:Outer membrane cobalamin receptor protein